ncbi:hypothetical protein EYF80_067828 [Liparis tanakae]|uniref:Uncharacterized protein n=1 Tax=Liparis tanakae TaxID=230148 RepID=A0A4Z2E016_9TELE|nr:hypothetical protein EYF80_067828 [Liparis tanakae]
MSKSTSIKTPVAWIDNVLYAAMNMVEKANRLHHFKKLRKYMHAEGLLDVTTLEGPTEEQKQGKNWFRSRPKGGIEELANVLQLEQDHREGRAGCSKATAIPVMCCELEVSAEPGVHTLLTSSTFSRPKESVKASDAVVQARFLSHAHNPATDEDNRENPPLHPSPISIALTPTPSTDPPAQSPGLDT